MAKLVRQRQDLLDRWQRTEEDIVRSFAEISDGDGGNIDDLRSRQAEFDSAISRIDSVLGERFPRFAEMSNPKPLSIAGAQSLLAADEAMVSFLMGEKSGFVWMITRNALELRAIDWDTDRVDSLVSDLRSGLDPMATTETDGFGLPRFFPAETAHEMYSALIAPFEPQLAKVETLYFIADGALQSLPIETLLTEPAVSPQLTLDQFADAPWLVKRFAVSYLPAESSLRALRQYAMRSRAQFPFLGIGDPILSDHPSSGGAPSDRSGSRRSFRGERIETRGLYTGTLADVEVVRSLVSLPETADELRRIGAVIGARESDILLGENASETFIKNNVPWHQYQVIAFATHGILAGELPGTAEPGLILTPPEKASVLDDGILTASEIAALDLDADWVILSACNTASSDGSPGAEGLSGLSKAFFFAGSRALFVSHWAVVSDPTVRLTTTMLSALKETPGLGRAEAHRRAVIDMMTNADVPYLAHPTVWAPFVVVGEGGPMSSGPTS